MLLSRACTYVVSVAGGWPAWLLGHLSPWVARFFRFSLPDSLFFNVHLVLAIFSFCCCYVSLWNWNEMHRHQSVKFVLILISTHISLIFIILELFSQSALRLTVSMVFCLSWVRVYLVHLSGYLSWVGVYFHIFLIDNRPKGILELYLLLSSASFDYLEAASQFHVFLFTD